MAEPVVGILELYLREYPISDEVRGSLAARTRFIAEAAPQGRRGQSLGASLSAWGLGSD